MARSEPTSPRNRAALLLVLFVAATALAAPVRADPRWWWDDQPLLPAREDRRWPDLAGSSGVSAAPEPFLVVFSERDPAEGDWELWMTASGDRGCTWCPAVRLTDEAEDDTRARIARRAAQDGSGLVVQMVFERGPEVMVATDVGTLPDGTAAGLCPALQELADGWRRGDGVQTLSLPLLGNARRPDIAVPASAGDPFHFHAVWEQDTQLLPVIYHAADLTGDGGWSPPAEILGGPFPGSAATEPKVTADGGEAPGESGVNVTWVLQSALGALVYVRSADSGQTWRSVGTADEPISDPGSVLFEGQDLAGAAGWNAAAWLNAETTPPAVHLDAMHLDTPSTADVPWADDLVLHAPSDPSAEVGDLALAALAEPDPSSPPRVFAFWREGPAGAAELLHRGGRLDADLADPRDFTRYPYAPVRPGDPDGSGALPLTGCSIQSDDLVCVPDRTAGGAGEIAAVGDRDGDPTPGRHFYAVWRDTREGVGNIWFKRSDTVGTGVVPTLQAECVEPDAARILVTWPTPQTCASAGTTADERMLRYLVYHGTDPGGPFANAADPVVVPHDAGLPTHEATIEGLARGTTYQVLVIGEDEARNLLPPDFDPAADGAEPYMREVSIRTPPGCGPCLHRTEIVDRRSFDPAAVFLDPRTPDGLGLVGPPLRCEIASPERDPDAVGASELSFYQVDRPDLVVTLRRLGPDLEILF